MASCKDCLYYDKLCFYALLPSELNLCKDFMNKADVVSVVRCKDCIHYKDEWCEILKAETPIAEGFCCYGERKCDNDQH